MIPAALRLGAAAASESAGDATALVVSLQAQLGGDDLAGRMMTLEARRRPSLPPSGTAVARDGSRWGAVQTGDALASASRCPARRAGALAPD